MRQEPLADVLKLPAAPTNNKTGPSFFEPSFYTEAPVSAATLPAAELPGLAADLTSLLAGLL